MLLSSVVSRETAIRVLVSLCVQRETYSLLMDIPSNVVINTTTLLSGVTLTLLAHLKATLLTKTFISDTFLKVRQYKLLRATYSS